MLSETDLSLVNALQIDPRAPWSLVGETLGIGAATAARRWESLVDEGRAWLSAYPAGPLASRMAVAFVQVDCAPGRALEAGAALAADPHVPTVECVAGPCDLLVHVVGAEFGSVAEYVVHRLSSLPGVARTRTLVSARLFSEGSRWQVRAISPGQQEALATRVRPPAGAPRFDELDRSLLLVLGEDGRLPYAELATRLGTSASTVRRRVEIALASGALRLRCELARSLSPAPVTTMLWLRVPPDRLESTARSLATLPEIRMCAAISGAANLLVVAWLRTPADSTGLEGAMVTKLPWVEIVDRAVTLRTVKLMGALLDETGHARARVPLDFWSPVLPR
ncbi:DNA-binding Lrp family transcriptional regulator [Amycolatopsis bartoniae]|uniref:AsnC family transcriptional regulator n=1 Tax=Amycolatopsis bartoniae TaxID=941986 RepID=A0A8H9M6D3_9PSEU|nr:AsnC family transcriptional regulator [Amycolatopsis bartoniae]MBB2937675.1 DNA-binding Lrp family transcriptional regulator [Amycolatopsis bartoniae]TVT01405.1 AsnC family transcriptional regulator [Amycolatopsis bartoniae]GHF64539.1 AsnC family transcriptional regulator [Amycolatopsis bartoniae]